MINSKRIGQIFGPILFIIIRLFFNPEGLSDDANGILASTVWIAIWWITEAITQQLHYCLLCFYAPCSNST
ncbi:hypothetical protein [Hyunsoonleella jejuensis]|uniref:hypothetical protein n=1 Tax=Hyunsoonleella jejuensis TaxID=419940 RepID=UPI00115FD57B|nr:hypothetical protein [Hyunsoonleella jejuensis]